MRINRFVSLAALTCSWCGLFIGTIRTSCVGGRFPSQFFSVGQVCNLPGFARDGRLKTCPTITILTSGILETLPYNTGKKGNLPCERFLLRP
jgi:hypothetical protein